MNYSQIAILFLQGTLVAFTILLLFRLRRRLGIGFLFACLGLFQFVQLILSSTVYVSITNNFFVSPGSTVFFTASLFALLIIYIKEDASETKKLIYALFIVNVIMAVILKTLGWNLEEVSIQNPFNVSTSLFDIIGKVLIVGTITLFLDLLLIIVLFEFISKRVRFLFLQIFLTMLIVVSFDTVLFSIFALSDFENLTSIIIAGLISKGVFVLFYSILFYVYLKYFDLKERESTFLKTVDVFKFRAVKQKLESAESEIKKAEEMYRILTDHSTDLICLHKPDSTFKYISPSIKNILGYDQSKFLGKQIFEIIHNDDIQQIQDLIEKKAFSDGAVDLISCRVRHKDGHFVWLEFLISLVYKEQEISYFVSTGRDITERVIANKKINNSLKLLEKSEYSLSKASRMAKIGHWEYDNVTDLLTWSDYIYRIYGLDPKEETLSREEMLVFFDKESQEKLLNATSELELKGIPYDLELKLINRRKEEIWVRTLVQLVYNPQNEIIGRRGVLHNITESKTVQLQLSTSLDLLEKSEYSKSEASKIAKIGYWEYNCDTDTVFWSEYLYHVFGFDPKKAIPLQKEIVNLYDKESQKKIEQANLNLTSSGINYDHELRLINLRNEEVWVRNVVQPVYNSQNEIVGRRGVLQDITISKLKQNELDQQSEKLYKLNIELNDAQELANVGSWFYDLSSQKSTWSDETFRIWGFDPKKTVPEGALFLSRIHKDDLALFNKATDLVFNEGASYDIEYRICLDNDEIKTIRSICKPIFGDDGTLVSLNGVNQDITEQQRKQDELDLKTVKLYELNDALNQAQKLSHIGSWQWNMATDEAEWSDEMYNIFGVTKENFYPSNENVMKMVLPEDLHKMEKGLGSLLIDNVFIPFEFRIKRPSGEIRNVYIMALEKNSQENVFGVTKDITERKKIEEENLRIKNNYRSLFDNATISIWNEDFTQVFKEIEELRKLEILNIKIYLEENPEVLLSLISKVIVNSVNEATLKLFKAKSNQDFFNNIHNTFGDDADKVFIMLIEAIWTNKKSFTSEVNYKKLNGDEFVALFSIPIPQTEEEQKIIPISIQNIQSIKDAESAKRESIKDLNEAQELAHVGSWLFNVLTLESVWSDETYRIWGFDLNETTPNENLIQNRIHIDDRELFLNAAELVYNKKVSYDIEYRICIPNVEEKWVRSICRPILDDTGNVIFLKGTNQDITEKKQAIVEIEKAEELYRLLTDNSNDVICLQEPDSTFKYLSPSLKKVLGYEPSEFIGKQIFSIVHNDDLHFLTDAIEQKVFSRGLPVDVHSFRARHKEGHYIWLEYLTSPVYIENEISYFVTSARDVTQRVEANEIVKTSLELLAKSEASKNDASEVAKIGYWEYNFVEDTIIWSDYIYHIYGLDSKDKIPSELEIIALYDEESKEKIVDLIQSINLGNPSVDIELKFTNFKNIEVWERSVVQPVYNNQNEIVGRKGVMQDITDSKKAQFELEQSKKEIESSLELLEKKDYSLSQTSSIAKIGYWEYDIATDLFTWSEYIYDIYGLDLKAKIPSRKEIVAFYDTESQEKLAQATLNLNLDGIPYDIELKIINLRKEEVWIRNVVQPVFNDQNEIVGRTGIVQDITASKNAQFQLELSKQEIQISLELLEKSEYSKNEASKIAEIGYWEHDFITDCVVWSDYVHHIFGSNPEEEVPGRVEVLERFDKESQEKITQATLDLASKGISYDLELYFVNRRNENVWIRNVAQPIYNEQKEIIGKRGVMQDITSSKKAKIELEDSKQKIEASLNLLAKSEYSKNEASKIAKIGYWEQNIATNDSIWSDYIYHIFGVDPKEEFPGREEFLPLFDKSSQERLAKALLDLDSKGTSFDLELNLINFKNEAFWIRSVGQAVYNDQNEIVGRRGVTQDITVSKKAQFELELSRQEIEASLNLLAKSEYSKNEASKIAKIGFLEDDIATDTFIWSDYMYYVFGFDPKEKVPSRKEIAVLFDEESQEKMAHATLELDSKGVPFDLELKLINLRNEEVWARIVVQPVYNDQNKIVKRRGVFQDITASKKAQFELELSKQEIEASLYELEKSEYTKNETNKVAKIGYHEYDIASDVFIWSEHLYDIFGFDKTKQIPPREEVFLLFDKESQEKMKQATLDLDVKGIPFDLELKINNLKNEEVWVRNIAEPVYNDQKELVGRRGITQNITNFKKVQIELELSRQEIETSLNKLEKSEFSKNEASKIAKIGFHEYEIATDTFIWSDYVYRVFGFRIKDGLPSRKEVMKLFDKESRKRMKDATLQLDLKGISYDLELRLINKKKKNVWIRIIAQPVYNEQNEIVRRRGILQDITAAKDAQLALEDSLELLERSEYSLKESSKIAKIGYHGYNIITDTIIWSDYMYEILGFEIKEGVPLRDEIIAVLDKESLKEFDKFNKELTLTGTSYDIELKFFNPKKEEEVWVRNVVQPVYNSQNEIVGRRGILQDITVSKKAQLALEASREKIKTSLDLLEEKKFSMDEASKVAKLGYHEYDIATDTFTWSDYMYHIYGIDLNERVPSLKEIILFFDKESQKIIAKSLLEIDTRGISYDIELKLFNPKKGEEVWVRNVVQPIYSDQDEIIGRRGVMQDITTSKKAQLALEASKLEITTSLNLLEEKKSSMDEASKVAKLGYHEYDIATDTFTWSDYVYHIYGVGINEPVPSLKEVQLFYDKESQKIIAKSLLELDTRGTSFDVELKLFNPKKGEDVWVRNVVQAVYNDQDEIVGRRGVMQDITERKRIEDEHLRIKDNYRRLFENATISIWNEDLTEVFKGINELKKLDIPDIKIYFEQHPDVLFSLIEKVKVNTVNKATLELYKAKNYEQFLGSIQDTFGKGAEKIFGNLLVSIWNNEKTFTSEVNFKTLEGEEFLALFSVAIPQTELEQKTVPVSIQSIQSIKDAELEKSKSIKKLKEAEKLANVGSWVFDISDRKSTWSEEMFFIWGFDLKKDAPGFDMLLNRIHKDDLEFFSSSVDKGITKGIPYDIEFRICPPNEEEKWIRGICQPLLGDNGEVLSLTGNNQDITEQKLATDEIEKAEEMYSLLTNNSNDIICLQELDSTFTYISPSIKNLLGYEQSDFLGKQLFDLVHKDDIEPLADAMEQRITNGVEDAATFRVRHKQGHFIWLESLSSPVYKDNKISYFVTSSRDVTEWIIARQKIQEYQTSLQKLTTEMTLIEEKQKKEIASNIHDHLSQSLVISKMKINELKKKSELKIINEDLKFIESHISEALENSRKITYELSPPVLYQLGIIDALFWLLEDVETTHNIKCVVNSNVNSIKLSDANSILLYRCVQEVIKNAVKYANASLLTLDLDKKKLGINITLTDNGGGFDTSTLNDYQNHSGSGFGLFAVQERVKNIQGEFSITSEINTGTSVKIFIPLAI